MKPVVDVVDQLLNAGINVTVYNGQLDLIVDTLGTCYLFSSIARDSKPIEKCQNLQKLFESPIVHTGQELWVKRLKWEGMSGFNKLRWTPLDDPISPGVTGAFYKTYKNFSFYWILKAGHMVRHWLL